MRKILDKHLGTLFHNEKIEKGSSFILLRHRVLCIRLYPGKLKNRTHPQMPELSCGLGGSRPRPASFSAWAGLGRVACGRFSAAFLRSTRTEADQLSPVFASVLAVVFKREHIEAALNCITGYCQVLCFFTELRECVLSLHWESNWPFGISFH